MAEELRFSSSFSGRLWRAFLIEVAARMECGMSRRAVAISAAGMDFGRRAATKPATFAVGGKSMRDDRRAMDCQFPQLDALDALTAVSHAMIFIHSSVLSLAPHLQV
jgi:hypothetical protein